MSEADKILETEFNPQFVKGMKDRMIVSYYKYGAIIDAFPEKVNALASLQQRLRLYAETGNTEYLMDVANFAMIEFTLPRHHQAHFEGTDDSGSPGRINLRTGSPDKRDNNSL